MWFQFSFCFVEKVLVSCRHIPAEHTPLRIPCNAEPEWFLVLFLLLFSTWCQHCSTATALCVWSCDGHSNIHHSTQVPVDSFKSPVGPPCLSLVPICLSELTHPRGACSMHTALEIVPIWPPKSIHEQKFWIFWDAHFSSRMSLGLFWQFDVSINSVIKSFLVHKQCVFTIIGCALVVIVSDWYFSFHLQGGFHFHQCQCSDPCHHTIIITHCCLFMFALFVPKMPLFITTMFVDIIGCNRNHFMHNWCHCTVNINWWLPKLHSQWNLHFGPTGGSPHTKKDLLLQNMFFTKEVEKWIWGQRGYRELSPLEFFSSCNPILCRNGVLFISPKKKRGRRHFWWQMTTRRPADFTAVNHVLKNWRVMQSFLCLSSNGFGFSTLGQVQIGSQKSFLTTGTMLSHAGCGVTLRLAFDCCWCCCLRHHQFWLLVFWSLQPSFPCTDHQCCHCNCWLIDYLTGSWLSLLPLLLVLLSLVNDLPADGSFSILIDIVVHFPSFGMHHCGHHSFCGCTVCVCVCVCVYVCRAVGIQMYSAFKCTRHSLAFCTHCIVNHSWWPLCLEWCAKNAK